MKYKTTAKQLRDGAINLRSCGYCDLHTLLKFKEPTAYACGVYGWNFDVYHVNGLTICTGYRGMPGKRLEHIAEYENKALALYSVPYEDRKAETEKLLAEFCDLNR